VIFKVKNTSNIPINNRPPSTALKIKPTTLFNNIILRYNTSLSSNSFIRSAFPMSSTKNKTSYVTIIYYNSFAVKPIGFCVANFIFFF